NCQGKYVSQFVDNQPIPLVFSCTVDDAKTILQCTLEAGALAWVAVGYSPQQDMVLTHAITGTPSNGAVVWYDISDYSLQGLGPALSLDSGSSASIMQNSTHTVLKFTQPYLTASTSSGSAIPMDSTGS